jgi:transcription-repair coupling factor (superfamily II helicase)
MALSFDRLLKPPARIEIGGVPEGHDARLVAQIAALAEGGVLHVARDDARLAVLAQTLGFFAPDVTIYQVPAWDCLPYDRVSPNAEIVSRRMDALADLALNPPGKNTVILTTVAAVLQRVPTRELLRSSAFIVRARDQLDEKALLDFLTRHGFQRAGTVMEPGDFAVRGGLIDVYPPGAEEPYRIDLFGDQVERLRRFDPLTQRSTGEAQELRLVPMSEAPLEPETIARFRQGYRHHFGAVTDNDPLYQAVSEGRKHVGMEHWLPLFHERLETLLDYAPDAVLTLDPLARDAIDARLTTITDYYEAREEARKSGLEEAGAPYKPLPPNLLYLDAQAWAMAIDRRSVAALTPNQLPPEGPHILNAGGKQGRDFAPERNQPGVNLYEAARDYLNALRKGGRRILVACFTPGARERFGQLLRDHGADKLADADTWAEACKLPPDVVGMVVLGIEHGFETDDLVVVGEQDVLGDRIIRPRRKSRRAANFIAEATSLSVGDLVVHVDHGIGRYEGLMTLEVSGAPHDCLLVVYDGGDKLYVPVENIEVLSRYGSEDTGVALDRLGGVGWQHRKARLKQRLKDMAEELIKIAAARQLRQAEQVAPPEGLYDEFCARFPYEETEDQARAIEDTLEDLASGKPMDRLVCGDVGFGKTEVALRAAFVAAMQGLQVAIVCPTTLLSRQHYQRFVERFRNLPLKIAQLSRLVTGKEATRVKQGLADGTIDIAVGTHALFGKGVTFKRLGLVVIDEEQHFGVKHKEKLKQLRAEVHVLTLTATPIPRTLQLALSGVREMSLIATPPVDRLAVRTFVLPFDPVIVREAILRERYRGGQVFYVCPRIEDLPTVAEFLREHVPEVRFAVAHGRLAATELEQIMSGFYDRQYDVLLSTTIVESGLDIPTANTLIVHRADMFGLAQLYQLRGRIGRSKVRGYAYLTLSANKPPTVAAEKRLQVLQALDSLGAGFQLASHDLDLRGAGNLLGEEQSGHIKEVGLELYQEMLEEAVAAAKGESAAEEQWSPQINLGTAVLIPETYVADLSVRLDLYRRLGRLEEQAEIDGFAAELADRFGPLPVEVKHLLELMAIKRLCRIAGIERVEAGPRGATITFRPTGHANPAGLVAWIAQQQGSAKLRPDQKLVLLRDWEDTDQRIAGTRRAIAKLAEIAQAAPKQAAS